MLFGFSRNILISYSSCQKYCPSHHLTIFFQNLDSFFFIQGNKEKHITTIRSEAERAINRTLPVCHRLTKVIGVQHYRSYGIILLLGSHPSLVVFKEKSEYT